MLGRIILRRWHPRNEETMTKRDDTYATRSRCPHCGDFAIEGQPHTCPSGRRVEKHTNPAAPKPDPK